MARANARSKGRSEGSGDGSSSTGAISVRDELDPFRNDREGVAGGVGALIVDDAKGLVVGLVLVVGLQILPDASRIVGPVDDVDVAAAAR